MHGARLARTRRGIGGGLRRLRRGRLGGSHLTTVRQPFEKMAAESIRVLDAVTDNPRLAPIRLDLSVDLIVPKSSGPFQPSAQHRLRGAWIAALNNFRLADSVPAACVNAAVADVDPSGGAGWVHVADRGLVRASGAEAAGAGVRGWSVGAVAAEELLDDRPTCRLDQTADLLPCLRRYHGRRPVYRCRTTTLLSIDTGKVSTSGSSRSILTS